MSIRELAFTNSPSHKYMQMKKNQQLEKVKEVEKLFYQYYSYKIHKTSFVLNNIYVNKTVGKIKNHQVDLRKV